MSFMTILPTLVVEASIYNVVFCFPHNISTGSTRALDSGNGVCLALFCGVSKFTSLAGAQSACRCTDAFFASIVPVQ